MTLGDFLAAQLASREPWNCSTLAADWAVARGHPDFAAAWRSITEPAACEAVPAEAGGLLALWREGIGDGLAKVDGPEAGDIAVLDVLGVEVGGIFTGKRWALRAERGLHFIGAERARVIEAWRP